MIETMTQFRQSLKTITPKLAEKYFEMNTGNRPVKPENVRFISAQLKSGNWNLGPDAIAFDLNGKLINGQHRLLACIETGISFESNVMFGLDPIAYNTIDTGVKRSGGDALSAIGTNQPMLKSAIIKMLLEYKKGKSIVNGTNESSKKLKITNQHIVDFYEKYGHKVEDAASIGQYVYTAPNHLFSSSVLGLFAYIFSEIDIDDCKHFFEMFRLGEGLSKGNPVHTLRTYLINDANATKKYTKRAKYTMVIESWNAFRTSKKITKFKVSSEGTLPKLV
jgi:hypothetical protein